MSESSRRAREARISDFLGAEESIQAREISLRRTSRPDIQLRHRDYPKHYRGDMYTRYNHFGWNGVMRP